MVDAVAALPPTDLGRVTTRTSATEAAERTGQPAETLSFGTVLSALNPLQYLPVVGTIYRAATGDEVAEPVRRIGSAVGSFLLGGPVGLAVNLATLLAEKVSGIDLDRSGQDLIAALGDRHQGEPAEAAATEAETDTGSELTEAEALNARELQRLHAAQAAYARSGSLTAFASAGLG